MHQMQSSTNKLFVYICRSVDPVIKGMVKHMWERFT